MRIRGHLNPPDPAPARDRDHVQHQGPPDSTPHPPGLDKQILDLEGVSAAEPASEADDLTLRVRRPRPPLSHREIRKLQRPGMRQQVRPVSLIGQRRPAVHPAQRCHVVGHRVANQDPSHASASPRTSQSAN